MKAACRLVAAALLTLCAVLPAPAFAWGALGHRTIAAIAWANVRPQTRAQMAALLAAADGLNTPECAVHTLSDASTWPDCVRGKDKDRFAQTVGWHFQNIEICAPFDPREKCRDDDCVTAQIPLQQRRLADRSLPPVERLKALAFLVHLVGDIHQPLHPSDNHDEGGNQVTVADGFWAGHSLHQMWDTEFAKMAVNLPGKPLVRGYSADERARLGGGDAVRWARESWGLARTLAYPLALGRDPCATRGDDSVAHVDDAEIAKVVPVVRRRLEQAGLRLTALLDATLAS